MLDECYHLEYSDYLPHLYVYAHNVSAATSLGILQVFYVEHGSQHRISNRTLYLNHRSGLFKFC